MGDAAANFQHVFRKTHPPFSQHAVDFVNQLCRKRQQDRMTMEQAARHPWLAGTTVRKPIDYDVGADRRSSLPVELAPSRGAGLRAMQCFLELPFMSSGQSTLNLHKNLFGYMFRCEESDEGCGGSNGYQSSKCLQEVSMLCYMYDNFAEAEKCATAALGWCDLQVGGPPEVERVQCLTQLVSIHVKLGKGDPEHGKHIEDFVTKLKGVADAMRNVNSKRAHLIAKFKLTEFRMEHECV